MEKAKNLNLPKSVSVMEMCIGEGAQNEKNFIPTEAKIFMVNGLIDAGFKRISVSNFAHPAFLPQYKDCEEVFRKINYKPGVEFSTPVNNMKALERAVALKKEGFGPQWISVSVATTDAFNMANIGKTTKDSWPEALEVIKKGKNAGFKIMAGITGCWHCTATGKPVGKEVAFEFAEKFATAGVDQLQHCEGSMGDGVTPSEVYEFACKMLDKYPNIEFHDLHLHDAFGFGLANYFAAMQAGFTNIDGCMGGAGGHTTPILSNAPSRGAKKSPMDLYYADFRLAPVTTEDLMAMLDGMGIETGVDVDKVFNMGRWWEQILGRQLWSFCQKTIVGERWDKPDLWHFSMHK